MCRRCRLDLPLFVIVVLLGGGLARPFRLLPGLANGVAIAVIPSSSGGQEITLLVILSAPYARHDSKIIGTIKFTFCLNGAEIELAGYGSIIEI
jgi:hypothetical protein